jgi:hypothetical protein
MATGFLSRLFGSSKAPDAVSMPISGAHERRIGLDWPDVEVSGESYHRDQIARLFHGIGRPEGGVTMQTAWLVPEPTNPYDKNAVRVIVRGELVGYVPAELAGSVSRACSAVGRGNVAVGPARVWARVDEGTWRARVTLTFAGTTEAEKDYAAERREAEADEVQRRAELDRKAAERAEHERLIAERKSAGSVNGEYWKLLKPSISELKRQRRFEEAGALLESCVGAAEREAALTDEIPDAWPSEQISVVLRHLREFSVEVMFLERYVAACGTRSIPESITMRLNRARLASQRDTTTTQQQ